MIEDSPNKILFKVTKPLPANDYLGSSFDQAYRLTEQLAAPILAMTKKFGATGHL